MDRPAAGGPQIDLELGEGSEDVEEHLPHRVSGVVELAAEGGLDPAVGQRVTDVVPDPGVSFYLVDPVTGKTMRIRTAWTNAWGIF
jgi:hypothetical protein